MKPRYLVPGLEEDGGEMWTSVINIDHKLFRVHRVKQASRRLDSTAANNAAVWHVWNFS